MGRTAIDTVRLFMCAKRAKSSEGTDRFARAGACFPNTVIEQGEKALREKAEEVRNMGKEQQLMAMIKDEMPRIMYNIDEQMAVAKAAGNMEEVRELQALRAEFAQTDINGIIDRLVFDLATFTLPEASIMDGPYSYAPPVIWPKTDAVLECCLAAASAPAAGQTNGQVYNPCGCGPGPGPVPTETFDLKACGFINWYLKLCLNTTLIGKYDACGSTNYLPFSAAGTTCVDNILCRNVTDLARCPEMDLCKVRSIAIRCKTCPIAQLAVDNKKVVTYLIIFFLPPCEAPANGAL